MSIIRQDYGNLADMATQQLLAPIFPTLVATKAVSKDGLFIINNTLYKATANIAQNAQIVVGTNASLASTISEELGKQIKVKKIALETAVTISASAVFELTFTDNAIDILGVLGYTLGDRSFGAYLGITGIFAIDTHIAKIYGYNSKNTTVTIPAVACVYVLYK